MDTSSLETTGKGKGNDEQAALWQDQVWPAEQQGWWSIDSFGKGATGAGVGKGGKGKGKGSEGKGKGKETRLPQLWEEGAHCKGLLGVQKHKGNGRGVAVGQKRRAADGRWYTKKDNVNSIDSWVLEEDQQTEDMPEIGIGSLEIGGGLGCGLFEDDGYTSLAMLCQECSDGDDDNNDNDDDDDDDADDSPGYADFANQFVRLSSAEQTAFLHHLEMPAVDGDPDLDPTEVAAEEGSADSGSLSSTVKFSVEFATRISTPIGSSTLPVIAKDKFHQHSCLEAFGGRQVRGTFDDYVLSCSETGVDKSLVGRIQIGGGKLRRWQTKK